MPLFKKMLKNKQVAGVKNSSTPVQDIQMFKMEGGKDFVVFNGPDEQLISGLAMGADGGIGGTYGVMPELYIKIMQLVKSNEIEKARELQNAADAVIYAMCSCHSNMYAVIKEILRRRDGLNIGGVRKPLTDLVPEDDAQVCKCIQMIDDAMKLL